MQATTTGASERFAREQASYAFRVYFPAGTDVAHLDQISSITGAGIAGLSGKVLRVEGTPIDHAGRGAYRVAVCREVNSDA